MDQARWQRATDWPLNVAASVFLLAYAWRVIGNLQPPHDLIALWVMLVVWTVFALDYLISLILARPRGRWFVRNLPQLIIVAVPALQPLRMLRLVRLVRPDRSPASVRRWSVALYVGSTVALFLFVGALMVLDAEQNAPGANIRNFGDAIWWAIVTVTTVGYGDFVPVTVQGRLVAACLMLTGVALIGTVTGTLASYFGERLHHERAQTTQAGDQASGTEDGISRGHCPLCRADPHAPAATSELPAQRPSTLPPAAAHDA